MNVDKDLKALDDLNEALKNILEFSENALSKIGDFEDEVQEIAQKEVDKVCEKVSKKASEKINVVRNQVVNNLHTKYVSATKVLDQLSPIVNAKITDIGSVISTLTNIAGLYTKPHKAALDYTVGFVATAIPKVMDSAEIMAKLYNLKDEIPIPEGFSINFNKLSFNIDPITTSEIITGKKELEPEPPAPPEPEPPKTPIGKLYANFDSFDSFYDYIAKNSKYYTTNGRAIVQQAIQDGDNLYIKTYYLSKGKKGWVYNGLTFNDKTMLEAKMWGKWGKGEIFTLDSLKCAKYLGLQLDKKNKPEKILYEVLPMTPVNIKNGKYYYNIYDGDIVDWDNIKTT